MNNLVEWAKAFIILALTSYLALSDGSIW